MSDNTPAGAQPTPPPAGYPGAQPPAYGAPAPGYAAPVAPPQGYAAAPPAYGAAPQYPAAGYAGYPAAPKTNSLAIVSLIASLVGVFVIPIIGQIVGVITGHMALGQLKTSGEGGRGLALAGTIIGWVSLGLMILTLILVFAVFVPFAVQNGARYGS